MLKFIKYVTETINKLNNYRLVTLKHVKKVVKKFSTGYGDTITVKVEFPVYEKGNGYQRQKNVDGSYKTRKGIYVWYVRKINPRSMFVSHPNKTT
jgi:tagatose-1,6-bisphosphate aldolase